MAASLSACVLDSPRSEPWLSSRCGCRASEIVGIIFLEIGKVGEGRRVGDAGGTLWRRDGAARVLSRSVLGLVSRASPVQTAVRNCTRDEGGPFGFGDQVADPKPPQAAVVKSHGGERCGNAGTMIPEGTVERGERKRTVSEVSKAD